MNQQLSNETGISVACLCLSEDDLQILLSAMSIECIRNMIHYLNNLPSLTRFDCEASLIDFLDIVINKKNTKQSLNKHIEKFLYASLGDAEAKNIIREISVDKKIASKLIFSIQKNYTGARNVSHAIEIILGIKQRLFDTSHNFTTVEFDHFTSELIYKFSQCIKEDSGAIASLIETQFSGSSDISSNKRNAKPGGRKKTVITLLQFDIRTFSRLFENLATIEKQAIVFEMNGLPAITEYELEQALLSYMQMMLNLQLVDSKQIEEVHLLISNIRPPLETSFDELEKNDGDLTYFENEDNYYDVNTIEELIKIAQSIIIKNPRLVARAIRHMFRQEITLG